MTFASLDNPLEGLFRFEADLLPGLQCIPMAVRYKLDMAGVKVSLKAWNRLPLTVREALLQGWPVETEPERRALREAVCRWLWEVTDEPVRFLPPEPEPDWSRTGSLPDAVAEAGAGCVPPLTVSEWAGLERLQRVALVKLAGSHHERGRFAAALTEFRAVG